MANPNNNIVTKIDLIKQQIEQVLSKLPSGQALENYLQNYPVDKLDVIYATTIRLFEVFSSIYANGSYDPNPLYSDHHPLGVDSGDYGLSFFDRFMYKPSADGTLHASAAGIGINATFGALALTTAIGRSIYDVAHKNKLKSRKRLKAVMARHLTEDEMAAYLKLEEEADTLIKESVKNLAACIETLRHASTLSEEELVKAEQALKAGQAALHEAKTKLNTDNKIQMAINEATQAFNTKDNPYHIDVENGLHQIKRVSGSIFNKKTHIKEVKSRKERVFSVIRKLDKHRYINRLAQPFTWATNQSMWYWLAWFTALAIVGPLAIAAPPVILGLALTAAIIGGGLSLWKAKSRHTLHNKHVDQRAKIVDILQRPKTVLESQFKTDIITMQAYYKNQPAYQRLKNDAERAAFLLRKYEKHDAADKANMETALKAWQSKTFMDFEHQRNLDKIDKIRENHALHVQEANIPDVPKKGIRSYLLSSTRKSRAVRHLYVINNVIAAMSFGIVIPFFITQLLAGFVVGGTILALHAGVAINFATLGGITGALNSGTVSAIWGAMWAAKNGITTFINQRRTRLSYADRVNALLKKEVNGETNEARFDRLQHSFDKKMAYLKTLKATNNDAYKNIKKQLVGWKQWSATNHHYHEKQREKATPWTRVKQVLNRGFEVFGGSQTGILVTRVLFLSGCVFVGLLASAATVAVSGVTFGLAPILFTVMAGVAGGFLGGNRLLKYHLRSRQEHRKNFLNTFDDRVKFLEQKNQELDKLLGIEPVVVNNGAPPPAPDHQADQAPAVVVRPAAIAGAQADVVVPPPAAVPGREKRVRATTESTTSPDSETIETPVVTEVPTTKPMQYEVLDNGKPFAHYAKHMLFKPVAEPIIGHHAIEEHKPPAINRR